MRIDPSDFVPPFDRTKSLATGVWATVLLRRFTEGRALYPADIDDDEAREIHEVLCRLLEIAFMDKAWQDERIWGDRPVKWSPIPFEPVGMPEWITPVPGVALLLLAGPDGDPIDDVDSWLERAKEAAVPLRARTLEQLAVRIEEILTFDTRVPNPAGGAEYSSPQRALLLFGKYWDSYRAVLDQYGSVHLHRQPHPMLRSITSLQHRLRVHCAIVGSDELREALEPVVQIEFGPDGALLWDEWAQPRINQLSEVFEELRAEQGSRAFELTYPEQLFLTRVTSDLAGVRKDAQRRLKALFAAKAPSAPDEARKVPLKAPKLSEEEEKAFALAGMLCRTPIHLTGVRGKRGSVVRIADDEVEMGDVPLKRFILLVAGLYAREDGWIEVGKARMPGGLVNNRIWGDASVPNSLSRVREPFNGRVRNGAGAVIPVDEFIRHHGGSVRIATHPKYITWDAGSLQGLGDKGVTDALGHLLREKANWQKRQQHG